MSDNLTGNGGSITVESCSASIGEWEITRYTGINGFSSWKGMAILKRESQLVGSAKGLFEIDGKTYKGNVTVNHARRNWERSAVEDRTVIKFRGTGNLVEVRNPVDQIQLI